MKSQEEKRLFRAWLTRNARLGEKTISDVVSRLIRLDKIAPLPQESADDNFLSSVSRNPQFLRLAPTVKSQLRRAYKLYRQFRDSG